MYQSPQSLFDPVIAFVGAAIAIVAAVLTLKFVDADGLSKPPGGLHKDHQRCLFAVSLFLVSLEEKGRQSLT